MDQGIASIGGFVYQVMAFISLSSELMILDNGTDYNSIPIKQITKIEADLLIKNFQDASFIHEPIKEDILASFEDGDNILIQVKYSFSPSKNVIQGYQITKMFEKFDSARSEYLEKQDYRIHRFVILSNRDLARAGKQQIQEYEDKGEKIHFHKCEKSEIMNSFQEFAYGYGCLDREIMQGVERAIGKVFRNTLEQEILSFSREEFVEILTGSKKARCLNHESIKTYISSNLRELKKEVNIFQWNNEPIIREVENQITTYIHRYYLVCISGKGGVGKSTLLWKLLNGFDYVSVFSKANSLEQRMIQNKVNEYRGLVRPSDDTIEDILERVKRANGTSKQIVLLVGLDGIDEINSQVEARRNVKKLLNYFYKKEEDNRLSSRGTIPELTLLVTCRKPEDFKNYLERHDDSFRFDINDLIIDLDRFSEIEKERAYQRVFPDLILENEDYRAFHLDKFLVYPIVWRGLLKMNTEEQKRILTSGDKELIRELSKNILNWVADKVYLLVKSCGSPHTKDQIKYIIFKIILCFGSKQVHREKYLSLLNENGISYPINDNVVSELLSVGFLDDIREKYVLRFDFMKCLVSTEDGE